jgi:hypothetical protein
VGELVQMELVKAYVNEKNEATIRCGACGRKKTADVGQYKDAGKKMKVTCPCGAAFLVAFELRRHYRKLVNLMGHFSRDGADANVAAMSIVNVSLAGIGIRTVYDHALQLNDVIRVTFELDDGRKSKISRNAIVRKIDGRTIGAEFCDNKNDSALAFYLLP